MSVLNAPKLSILQADSRYINIASDQTVAGLKSFQNGINIGSLRMLPLPTDPTRTTQLQSGLYLKGSLQMYNNADVANTTRIPFNINSTINGSTLDPAGKSADKVGAQLNVTVRGDFTNEATIGATDAGFVWGADDFILSGNNAGDLAGITDFWGRETEIHLRAPNATLTSLKGVHVETAIESTSTNTTVASAFGIHITNQNINGAPSGTTVTNWYGIKIDSPTYGTNNYALHVSGQAASVFGGDILMNSISSQPHTLNAYYGGYVGTTVLIKPPNDATTSVAKLTVRSQSDSDVVAAFRGRAGQTGDILQIGQDTSVFARFDKGGRLAISNTSAPADATLNANEAFFYVDSTANAYKVKVKTKDASSNIKDTSLVLSGDKMVVMTEAVAPSNVTGSGQIYVSSTDHKLHFLNTSGTDTTLGVGSTTAISRSINTISTATTLGATTYTDYIYLVSGTTTCTLPTAISNTNLYTIKNTGSNTVTLATSSSQTIDTYATYTISAGSSITVISDNANWRVI